MNRRPSISNPELGSLFFPKSTVLLTKFVIHLRSLERRVGLDRFGGGVCNWFIGGEGLLWWSTMLQRHRNRIALREKENEWKGFGKERKKQT